MQLLDLNGNRTQAVYPTGVTANCAYDVMDRLSTLKDGASQTPHTLATYSYDSLGRVTEVALGNGTTVTPSYDLINQIRQPIAGEMPTKQKMGPCEASSSTEAVCERLACIHPDVSMHGPTPIQHSSLPTTEIHRIDCQPWRLQETCPTDFILPSR